MTYASTQETTAFLGIFGLGAPELIIVFIVLGFLAVLLTIIISVVKYSNSRSKHPALPPPLTSAQSRLAEIDSLRSKNMISDSEYAEKRKQIINDI